MIVMTLALAVFAMLALAAYGGIHVFPAIETPGPSDPYQGPLSGETSVIVDLGALASPPPAPAPAPAPAPICGWVLSGLRWKPGIRSGFYDLFADGNGVWVQEHLGTWRQLSAHERDPMRLAHWIARRFSGADPYPYRRIFRDALRLANALHHHGPDALGFFDLCRTEGNK